MDFPTKLALASFFVAFVNTPILVLIHELGHAAAVVRAGRRPRVFVGPALTPLFRHSFNSFDLVANPLLLDPRGPIGKGRTRPMGLCQFDQRGLTIAEHRSILRGGPLASALAALALAGTAYLIADTDSALFWIATAGYVEASLQAVWNLIPRRASNGLKSDGERLREMERAAAGEVPVPAPPLPAESRPVRSVPPPGYE